MLDSWIKILFLLLISCFHLKAQQFSFLNNCPIIKLPLIFDESVFNYEKLKQFKRIDDKSVDSLIKYKSVCLYGEDAYKSEYYYYGKIDGVDNYYIIVTCAIPNFDTLDYSKYISDMKLRVRLDTGYYFSLIFNDKLNKRIVNVNGLADKAPWVGDYINTISCIDTSHIVYVYNSNSKNVITSKISNNNRLPIIIDTLEYLNGLNDFYYFEYNAFEFKGQEFQKQVNKYPLLQLPIKISKKFKEGEGLYIPVDKKFAQSISLFKNWLQIDNQRADSVSLNYFGRFNIDSNKIALLTLVKYKIINVEKFWILRLFIFDNDGGLYNTETITEVYKTTNKLFKPDDEYIDLINNEIVVKDVNGNIKSKIMISNKQ